jgi:hypothetical protein
MNGGGIEMFFYFFDPNGAWGLFVVIQYCFSHGLAITSDSITNVFLMLLQAAAGA